MEKQKKVLDASIVVKWFTKEKDIDKALKLKESHIKREIQIVIPELLILEVLNSLRFKENNEETIIEVNKTLWELGFSIEKLSEIVLTKTVHIAKQYNITMYDALYVAIAHFHGAPLITADRELYNIPNVISLENT